MSLVRGRGKNVRVCKTINLACGGKDAENSTQSRRFLPPFHRYRDLYGKLLGLADEARFDTMPDAVGGEGGCGGD
jgi:hypothetical protein